MYFFMPSTNSGSTFIFKSLNETSVSPSSLVTGGINLTKESVKIILDGGVVDVHCKEDGVWVSGDIKYVFSGKISSLLFDDRNN